MNDDHVSDSLLDHFGGDMKALNRASRFSNMACISWSDMVQTYATLPELETQTRYVIKWRLGYMPPEYVLLSYEYRLREYVKAHLENRLSLDDFLHRTDNWLRLARNCDIERHLERNYDSYIYDQYNHSFLHVAQKARDRLSGFLGYEPGIEASAEPELMLRSKMADDTVHLPEFLTSHDLQLLQYISYREVYLSKGFRAAEDSPLITQHLMNKHHPGRKSISDVTGI